MQLIPAGYSIKFLTFETPEEKARQALLENGTEVINIATIRRGRIGKKSCWILKVFSAGKSLRRRQLQAWLLITHGPEIVALMHSSMYGGLTHFDSIEVPLGAELCVFAIIEKATTLHRIETSGNDLAKISEKMQKLYKEVKKEDPGPTIFVASD